MTRHIVPDVVGRQDLAWLAADATVQEAAQIMARRRLGAILVMQDRRLLGIFTERDLVARVVANGRPVKSTRLAEVMTARPETVAAHATATQALAVMQAGGFRHLPVVDNTGAVVAVVSMRDFIGAEFAEVQDAFDLQQRIAEG